MMSVDTSVAGGRNEAIGFRPGSPAEVVETHSAVIFFVGDRVYKLKKPVDLGFLDFRSREARETVCHREVALNRRLSADVYLGVADVTGPDGKVCDHLIVMRRLPEERRLSSLVRAATPSVPPPSSFPSARSGAAGRTGTAISPAAAPSVGGQGREPTTAT